MDSLHDMGGVDGRLMGGEMCFLESSSEIQPVGWGTFFWDLREQAVSAAITLRVLRFRQAPFL